MGVECVHPSLDPTWCISSKLLLANSNPRSVGWAASDMAQHQRQALAGEMEGAVVPLPCGSRCDRTAAVRSFIGMAGKGCSAQLAQPRDLDEGSPWLPLHAEQCHHRPGPVRERKRRYCSIVLEPARGSSSSAPKGSPCHSPQAPLPCTLPAPIFPRPPPPSPTPYPHTPEAPHAPQPCNSHA